MMFLQMNRPAMTRTTVVLMVAAMVAGGTALGTALAQEESTELKPAAEMTIAEIMKEAHKAPSRLLKKVADTKNEASGADKQRLLDLYKSMAAQDPPQGDKADWKERNDLLIASVEGVIKGEEGAKSQLKKASNCVKCHKEHKPKS
jgi:hypothetical protein